MSASSDIPFKFDTTISSPAAVWDHYISQAHLRGVGYLLVEVADFAAVNLDAEVARFEDPITNPPQEAAHFQVLAKSYQRERDMMRALMMAILEHLDIVLPDVYTDCITACGGQAKFHTLTIPQITTILRAEIAVTDEANQVSTLATLANEGINTSDPSPCRALEARVLLLIIELGRTNYVHPASDLLRLVRTMFLAHCPTNNQLQIAYSEYHSKVTAQAPATGAGLLNHMTTLEKTTRAQGGCLFPDTLGTQHHAGKAVQSAPKNPPAAPTNITEYVSYLTRQLATTRLTPLQQQVMKQHMEATVSAVNFAGAHPKETKLRAHFCPMHMFNETHPEADCNSCKALSK